MRCTEELKRKYRLDNLQVCRLPIERVGDEKGGTTFGRWMKQAPYAPRCRAMALPEQYAAAELFRGTILHHSLVAYRDDGPGAARCVSFAGDAWPAYVPVRMADTICVEERLPPGAAAVLINRNHTYTDLYLPIDATEKRLFDAVDGEHSIRDIVDRALPSILEATRLDLVRAFFERLWCYDQVVFDTSDQR